ncbi:MAG: DUF2281 domain-containing protein [Crocosphaera sp.]|nr:DUF2281 domain-containing protein [Crocosphaera sp.]
MTKTINRQDQIIAIFKELSPEKQQEVLDFARFLQYQAENKQEKHETIESKSLDEVAETFAGCLDGGPEDLSTNKEYLRGLGQQ